MTISTYSRMEQSGFAGRIRGWLAERESRPTERREFAAFKSFNDHLRRDIGIRRKPSHSHRRHLMRF